MVEILAFLGVIVGAYVLGGINGAIVTSRLLYNDDVRTHGSGNAGLTNFFRTYGGRAMFLVILIDVLKTAFPVVVGGMILESYLTFGLVQERVILGRALGGLFAMIGHAYPCFYKFRGGKAALSGGTVALFLDARVFLILLVVFVLTVAITRYVSLGSILAGIAFPVSFLFFNHGLWPTVLVFCCGAFVVFRHHTNIRRLIKGEERKQSFSGKGKT